MILSVQKQLGVLAVQAVQLAISERVSRRCFARMSACLACCSEKRVYCNWTLCLDMNSERTNYVKSVAPESILCHVKRSLHIAKGYKKKREKKSMVSENHAVQNTAEILSH